jgi:hypothetical protein
MVTINNFLGTFTKFQKVTINFIMFFCPPMCLHGIPVLWLDKFSGYLIWCVTDVCSSVHRCICIDKKNLLDATEWFIALIICSTCFRHFYAHHQGLETIRVLLPPTVCSAWLLVVGGQVQDSMLCVQEEGCWTTESCNIPLPGRTPCCSAPDPRQPATKHCTP